MVRGSVKTHTAVMTGPFCLQEENMFTDDEKDYLMRIIKEVARVLGKRDAWKKICAGRAPGRIQIPDFR